ncbi:MULTISPECIES: nucleoside triphosphate pyrophosphohydrolase family protein [Enterobacteriaceae]|uniref:hypothetical protein n=1 Tax=Enterobacteriaceae TaxID=543 RepID=UPI000AE31B91|nr:MULTISPECIES: hypothetical protein [Enterobacteriaceae]CAE7358678.1 hypothetical protein AI2659V1_0030 [Enterobacter cloacae]MDU1941527.1 hypothetical protein [Cronobacter sakazakii]MDU7220740.1 hypothetical protein [Citrobacter freundii]CAE7393398.1 hypothetical protein AI2666V1_1371 [Citrobacter freundii]CAE7396729.1 hypothetical protein AI2668V1_1368 [Citrobacter freundii]
MKTSPQLETSPVKELVRAGHEFAAAMGADTPLIEIAKLVSRLATALDVQLARANTLASLAAEPAGWQVKTHGGNWKSISDSDVDHYRFNEELPVREVYTAPPAPVSVPDDYFSSLVAAARVRADKAMRKFPQPNYVLNKVAEESGEVIKAVIHFTEGREEWRNVEGEIIDNLAMLIRLVMEGDQVIGFTPPDARRAAMLLSISQTENGK